MIEDDRMVVRELPVLWRSSKTLRERLPRDADGDD